MQWMMRGCLFTIYLHYLLMPGMILVETALQIPFPVMLWPGFIGTVSVELEEAAFYGAVRINCLI